MLLLIVSMFILLSVGIVIGWVARQMMYEINGDWGVNHADRQNIRS